MFLFPFLTEYSKIFFRSDRTLRAGSNAQNVPGMFQKLLHKSAVAHGQHCKKYFGASITSTVFALTNGILNYFFVNNFCKFCKFNRPSV